MRTLGLYASQHWHDNDFQPSAICPMCKTDDGVEGELCFAFSHQD